MKYYLISGEASGDLHGSHLIAAIKKLDPNAHFRAWGGDLIKKEGVELVKHYKDIAYMGLWEVIRNLINILKNIFGFFLLNLTPILLPPIPALESETP